jgi:3-methyladenine DNA glycosylase AlkD
MSDLYYEGIFDIISSISNENYYVKMACAWLISYCYINNPADTLAYLKGAKIDRFTYNKSLQKIIESYRVSDVDKETLKGLRNKISK